MRLGRNRSSGATSVALEDVIEASDQEKATNNITEFPNYPLSPQRQHHQLPSLPTKSDTNPNNIEKQMLPRELLPDVK